MKEFKTNDVYLKQNSKNRGEQDDAKPTCVLYEASANNTPPRPPPCQREKIQEKKNTIVKACMRALETTAF